MYNNLAWENYGDVNPLQHGGIFVKRDIDRPNTCFNVVKNVFDEDGKQWIIFDTYVDITDSWIDKQRVMDFAGLDNNSYTDIHYAIACTDYYGYIEFSGDKIVCDNENELEQELRKFGIEPEITFELTK